MLAAFAALRRHRCRIRYDQTEFTLVLRLRSELTAEHVQRIRTIAAKCPVHRVLAGEVSFVDRVELVEPDMS